MIYGAILELPESSVHDVIAFGTCAITVMLTGENGGAHGCFRFCV
jgi:ribosomal protein S4E